MLRRLSRHQRLRRAWPVGNKARPPVPRGARGRAGDGVGPRPRAGDLSGRTAAAGGSVLPPGESHPYRDRPRAVGLFGESAAHAPRDAPDGCLREAGAAPAHKTRFSRQGGGARFLRARPLLGLRQDLARPRAGRGDRRESRLARRILVPLVNAGTPRVPARGADRRAAWGRACERILGTRVSFSILPGLTPPMSRTIG